MKFKVGDAVRLLEAVSVGIPREYEGQTGEIISISKSSTPYCVEFRDHVWYANAAALELTDKYQINFDPNSYYC